jgi:hypothetical protein
MSNESYNVIVRLELDDDSSTSVTILECRGIGYLSDAEGPTNKPIIFDCSPKGHQMKMVVPTVSL